MITQKLQPGDVIATRSHSFFGRAIRAAAALRDKPDLENHIAIVYHYVGDICWVIEGRPGGVGWRDASEYLRSPWTISNAAQPKTLIQRNLICATVKAAIGTKYDWDGIAKDAADAIHLDDIFGSGERWGGKMPGHVVCSSLAQYGYFKGGTPRPPAPHGMEQITPADWTQFIITEGWR